ncbi:MAG TPA: hypothetical protein VEV62_03150 [Parafilimonas sp.]|jgi:hypothetical protein|nr:hypothetical protein [Parafilimonas sp.]
MKSIFYTKYTHKWQNILTITHFVFFIFFIASLILMELHDSWLSNRLLIAAISIALVLSVFKMVAIKKRDVMEVKSK